MSMDKYYILYGTKGKDIFYIKNLDPIIWDYDISYAKRFTDSKSASNSIMDSYSNLVELSSNIQRGLLDDIYVSSRNANNIKEEFDRRRIL